MLRSAAIALVGLVLATAGLAGCGRRTPPRFDNKPVVGASAPAQSQTVSR